MLILTSSFGKSTSSGLDVEDSIWAILRSYSFQALGSRISLAVVVGNGRGDFCLVVV
jgi:hypothetical protein